MRVNAVSILKQNGERYLCQNRSVVARRWFSSNTIEDIKKEIDESNKKRSAVAQRISSFQRARVPRYLRNIMKSLKHGRMPPEIHNEFSLPKAFRSNKKLSELAQSVLNRSFLHAKSNPWMTAWWIAREDFDPKEHDKDYLLKYYTKSRANLIEKHPDRFKRVGAIIMEDPETGTPLVGEYSREVRHHFCNAPSFSQPNTPSLGPTHVALGFNDLQVLLPDANSLKMKPLRFIGYERSTYSIAKSLVIAHMLRSTVIQPHHIIEAWYSSTWTYETLMFFRSSCLSLLSEGLPPTTGPLVACMEVQMYLHHWAHTAVPSRDTEIIEKWMLDVASAHIAHTSLSTCSFRRKKDRIALLNYFMTGALGPHCFVDEEENAPESVASLAMFCVPEGAPPPDKVAQESISNTILLQSLKQELDTNPNVSIVEAMYNMKARQIRLLQEGLQSGEVQLDLRYGDIQPLGRIDPKLLLEIQAFGADTMSWSNLLDFFWLRQLHELAHFWSTGTTTHFGYTMNWTRTCYGTSIEDYPTLGERTKILHETVDTIEKNAKKSGVDQYISVPSFDEIEHLMIYHLSCQLRPHWVKYFRNEAQSVLAVYGTNLFIEDDVLLHSPLFRANWSTYLSWKYRS